MRRAKVLKGTPSLVALEVNPGRSSLIPYRMCRNCDFLRNLNGAIYNSANARRRLRAERHRSTPSSRCSGLRSAEPHTKRTMLRRHYIVH
jgi:hypothetical protein